jgi:thioredoxin-related protein
MKNLILSILLLFTWQLAAQDATLPFWLGSFDDLLLEAKKQNKPLLLYFHFDGCGACRKMEKDVFVDPGVQRYYGNQFLCYSINSLKDDGPKLKERFGVSMQPAFVFANTDGVPEHKVVGLYTPDEFISVGKKAVDKWATLYQLRKKYAGGDRSAALLFEYIYALRDAAEDDPAIIRQYLKTQTEADLSSPENIKLIYEFFLIHHKPVFRFSDPAFQFMANNRALFEQFFEADQVNVRLIWATGESISQFAADNDEASMHQMVAFLDQCVRPDGQYFYNEMDGRQTGVIFHDDLVGSAWRQFYRKSGNMPRYLELLDQKIESIWDNWSKLNEEAWSFYMSEEEPALLQKAVGWAKRSVELKPAYMNTDTYAALLFKTGEYAQAEEIALQAIELGKAAGANFDETEGLLAKIQEAKE